MRTTSILLAAAGVALGFSLGSSASADVVTLLDAKDNTIYEEDGSASNGAGQHLFAGRNAAAQARRGLLAFDVIAEIPAGSIINSVSLQLNMSRTIAGVTDVSLHPLTSDWGEGTADAAGQEGFGAPASPTDATWTKNFFGSSAWTTLGGDFGAVQATTAVDGLGFYSWSSASLVGQVQAWLDGTSDNYGWAIIGEEATAVTAKRFDSAQNPDGALVPQLTVDFTIPAPSSVALLGLGVLGVTRRRRG